MVTGNILAWNVKRCVPAEARVISMDWLFYAIDTLTQGVDRPLTDAEGRQGVACYAVALARGGLRYVHKGRPLTWPV